MDTDGSRIAFTAMDAGGFNRLRKDADLRQSEVMPHPGLYSAYPATQDIMTLRAGTAGGSYTPGGIGAAERIRLGQNDAGTDAGRVRSTNLHELQHSVQNREGFARGGNPSSELDSIQIGRAHV